MLESQHEHIISNDILVVDDEISNLQLLSELLGREGYQVRPVNNPKLAIDSVIKRPPKLILLDVKMPGIDGYEVCKRLKQNERTRDIPILFVSALQNLEDRIKGFQVGGVDFVSKPFQEDELLARVRTHMDLRNLQLSLETLVSERTGQLSISEAKYRSLVDNSIVGVFTSTLDGRFLFTNDAVAQMFDFDSCEEMIEKGSIELWKDIKDRERFLGEIQKHGQMTNFEIQTLTNAGQEKTVLFSAKLDGDNITGMVMDITKRKQAEDNLQKAYNDIKQLQKQLQAESTYLQEEIKLEHNFENIIGQSEALKYVLHRVEQVAPQDSSVLIQGETGTGKELIARALHRLSSCCKRPLVKVNCAALPAELIESELFGREKGAFTGATTTTVGRFELAKGTTLFLDEIGELPLALQAKLLRVIESGEFERLGSSRTIHSNARIVAATNRDLEQEVRKKHFREDLFYRLRIFPITLPPLRDRLEDVPLLVSSFVTFFTRKMGQASFVEVPQKSMQALLSYHWPGNVRELKHVVEGAMIGLQGKKLNFDLPKTVNVAATKFKSFEEMERDYILEVLKAKNWKIEGEDNACSILGMPPSSLRSRMKKLGLKRP
jgi:PAS domain S-box-containing protein